MVIMLIFKIYLLGHQVHFDSLFHSEGLCDIFQPGKMQKQTFTCRMAAPHMYLLINNNC